MVNLTQPSIVLSVEMICCKIYPENMYTKKHARDLVSYFDRYCGIFFTNPESIRSESGHKRAWICDAMRRFGEYYDRKFCNAQLKVPNLRNNTQI